MNALFQIFRQGLQKTKTTLVRGIQAVFSGEKAWTDETFNELEAVLIQADLGLATATQLAADLRDRYRRGLIATTDEILKIAAADIMAILEKAPVRSFQMAARPPTVILMVGVNGSGKTTTVAKLGAKWQEEGRSVMFAACDTFRAAAIEQLQLWGQRLNCPVVAGRPGSDAASVAFDAVNAAIVNKADLLLIDTAGRQHTRKTLMDELAKVSRTVAKACPGAPHEVWLTIDASIGTNAVVQAREFGRQVNVTGLILTKLDGTGKGGSIVAIRKELGYPVLFIGLGEQVADLQPFNAEYFTRAIFDGA